MHWLIFTSIGVAAVISAALLFNGNDSPVNVPENNLVRQASQTQELQKGKLFINTAELEIEIADSEFERKKGLSNREHLAENAGMLFIFEVDIIPNFWMEEMKFPIDIIWIDKSRKVIGIEHNIKPETFPRLYSPQTSVRFVLETNAGWALEHMITVGNEASFHVLK